MVIKCPNCREDVKLPLRRDKHTANGRVALWVCPRCKNVMGGSLNHS